MCIIFCVHSEINMKKSSIFFAFQTFYVFLMKIFIIAMLFPSFLCIILTETVINLQDEEGFTPLMWAAAHGQIAVVEFLLQNVRKKPLLDLALYLCSGCHFKSFCILLHLRVLTLTSWPKEGKVHCLWPAARDTLIL